jgi:membrane dipeptidase
MTGTPIVTVRSIFSPEALIMLISEQMQTVSERRGISMSDSETVKIRAAQIHSQHVVIDGHCHLAKGIVNARESGETDVFKKHFLPLLQAGGVRAVLFIIGGDNVSMVNGSDLFLWGTLNVMDHCFQEIEANRETLSICTTAGELDQALADGKIAFILGLEGGRPLEGRPMQDELSTLRILYRLGVRSVQLTGNGRNRLADGVAETGTNGGLTRFGRAVVEDMNRLGMLLDISHLAPAGVEDVLSIYNGGIVASHANARAVCNHPRNLTDDVIRAIAERKGVVGLSLFSTLIDKDKEMATVEDLVDHIDHIASLVGIDYVALGPDFSEFAFGVNAWTGGRGNMEGMNYGSKEHYFHPQLKDWRHFPHITECMLQRGYAEEDVAKVLGENFLRLYRTAMA